MKRICGFLALLMLLPVLALAAQTAPLSMEDAAAVPSVRDQGRITAFQERHSYNGVRASDQWMRQVRLDGMLLNLRLYARDGSGILLQEKVTQATDGENLQLILRQENNDGGLLLQMDERALEVLERLHVAEIAVVDYDYYIQSIYPVASLAAIREMLSLEAGEELCVSGPEDPLSVVSESGVRRVITAE